MRELLPLSVLVADVWCRCIGRSAETTLCCNESDFVFAHVKRVPAKKTTLTLEQGLVAANSREMLSVSFENIKVRILIDSRFCPASSFLRVVMLPRLCVLLDKAFLQHVDLL